jgi:hypothetical protein
MYVSCWWQALPTNIHFLVKFRFKKNYKVPAADIKLIFLKLWIFTNFNTVFPVLVLVFDFEEFSEGVLHVNSVESLFVYCTYCCELYLTTRATCIQQRPHDKHSFLKINILTNTKGQNFPLTQSNLLLIGR